MSRFTPEHDRDKLDQNSAPQKKLTPAKKNKARKQKQGNQQSKDTNKARKPTKSPNRIDIITPTIYDHDYIRIIAYLCDFHITTCGQYNWTLNQSFHFPDYRTI